MAEKILLGFEVKTGKPVQIGLHHLVVVGMTQLSGKTTTLEALISRSGLRAIAFKTKRGEAGFHAYNHIPPYYKARSDWQYVEGLVSVALGEKVRFEPAMRWSIMKACEGATDLSQVQENARQLSLTVRAAIVKQALEKLVAYLSLVIPELEKWTFTDKISLASGVNVMDLEGMRIETQQLVIGSTIDYSFHNLENIVIIIPEAWEMLPEGRATPVKLVAEQFIRKGAAIGDYLWIDTQDIGGVSKVPLRQCDNWIMGRMREAHEVERILKQLLGVKIPREEIQTLKLGHFFAVIGDKVKKVYVLPAGVPETIGQNVAMGRLSPETVRDRYLMKKEGEEDLSWKEPFEGLKARVDAHFEEVKKLAQDVGRVAGELNKVAYKAHMDQSFSSWESKFEEKIQGLRRDLAEIKGALKGKPVTLDIKPSDKPIDLGQQRQSISLQEKELVIDLSHVAAPVEINTDDPQGIIMLCAIKDLKREGFDEMELGAALKERGCNMEPIVLHMNLGKLTKRGWIVKSAEKKPFRYRLPSKLTVNVKEPT